MSSPRRRAIFAFLAVATAIAELVIFSVPTAGGASPPVQKAERVPSGAEVMDSVNRREIGADSRLVLELALHDAQRGEYVREVEVRRKATSGGYRTVYRFTSPEHLRGIALLLIEETERDDMWMYFPSSDHLTRVVTRGLSALASDFSCEDLRVTFPLLDFDFRSLGAATPGIVEGSPTIRVRMTPNTERLRRELGYHSAIGVVSTDHWMIRKADFFDAQGEIFKSFESEPPVLIDGVWMLPSYSMVNHRARHETWVTVRHAEHGLELPLEIFEPESLRQE